MFTVVLSHWVHFHGSGKGSKDKQSSVMVFIQALCESTYMF